MAQEPHDQLFQAAFTGNVLLLESLLRDDSLLLDRAPLSTAGETPVHVAALRGHSEFVARALRHSPRLASETDSRGLTPLHVAAGVGSNDVVKEILRHMSEDGGVVTACLKKSKDGRIPLHLALEKARLEVAVELARACPASTRERGLMQLCVRSDFLEGLKLIAQMDGGDALLGQSDDDDGNTLLHLAVLYKQFQTIKYLVAKTGDKYLNAQNKNGLTPLDLIYNSRRDMESLQILTFLLESGSKRSDPGSAFNPATTNHPPNPPKKRLRKLFRYTPAYTNELDGLRGPLIITAAVLAAPAFQLGVNPPQDGSDMTNIWGFTSISITCSLTAIALLISGIPLKRSKVCVWLVVSLFLASMICFMIAYWSSILSTESRYTDGIGLTDVCLGFFAVAIGVGLLHLVRLVAWVWMKAVKCGRKRRATSRPGEKDVSDIA